MHEMHDHIYHIIIISIFPSKVEWDRIPTDPFFVRVAIEL